MQNKGKTDPADSSLKVSYKNGEHTRKDQEGTNRPLVTKKYKKNDKLATQIYRAAIRTNGKETKGTPSEEDKIRS